MNASRPISVALLCALLPQLLLALFAPAFVVCVEDNGSRALELSAAGCCQDDATQSPRPSTRGQDDCGGCEDALLSLDLQRDEGQTPALAPLSLAPTQPFPVNELQPRPLWRSTPSRAPPPGLRDLRTVNLRC